MKSNSFSLSSLTENRIHLLFHLKIRISRQCTSNTYEKESQSIKCINKAPFTSADVTKCYKSTCSVYCCQIKLINWYASERFGHAIIMNLVITMYHRKNRYNWRIRFPVISELRYLHMYQLAGVSDGVVRQWSHCPGSRPAGHRGPLCTGLILIWEGRELEETACVSHTHTHWRACTHKHKRNSPKSLKEMRSWYHCNWLVITIKLEMLYLAQEVIYVYVIRGYTMYFHVKVSNVPLLKWLVITSLCI